MPYSSNPQVSGIFISYRREDASGHAGRLFDDLVEHFGKDHVFMDVDKIEPGEDFVEVIENAVGSCEVLIAVIGKHWLTSDVNNDSRLNKPDDFVHVEIAAALQRKIRVIPVLVQKANMPDPKDLPDDLQPLSRRNAVELTDVRWQRDVQELVEVLERVLAQKQSASDRIGALNRTPEAGEDDIPTSRTKGPSEEDPSSPQPHAVPTVMPNGRAVPDPPRLWRFRQAYILISAITLIGVIAGAYTFLHRPAAKEDQSNSQPVATPTSSATIPPKSNDDNRIETTNSNANSGRPIVIASPIKIFTPTPNNNRIDNSNTRQREAREAMEKLQREENANRAFNRAMSNVNKPK